MALSLTRILDRHFYLLSLFSWLFGALLYFAVFVRDGGFGALDWKITQYFVSYWDYGFIKRGVVGTIVHPLFSNFDSHSTIPRLFIIIIDFAVFVAFVVISNKRLRLIEDNSSRLLLRALLVFSPLGFCQWSFDVGRYDHIALVLTLSSCFLLEARRFFAAGMVMIAAVICHEAAALYGCAIMFILILTLHNNRYETELLNSLFKSLAPPIFAFCAIIFWGNIEETYQLTYLERTHGGGWSVWGRGALQPALHLPIAQYGLNAFYFLLVAILFYPTLKASASKWAIIMSILPILLLFLAGIDYPRWIHLFFMSCFILILFLPAARTKVMFSLSNSRLQLVSSSLLLIPFGPIGITAALPYVSSMLKLFF
tara:strand:+ start:351 stop:1457 length:1107 start_codon:yes stop_codon:yes gene_type:complete